MKPLSRIEQNDAPYNVHKEGDGPPPQPPP